MLPSFRLYTVIHTILRIEMEKLIDYAMGAKEDGATREQAAGILASILYIKRDLNVTPDDIELALDEVYDD